MQIERSVIQSVRVYPGTKKKIQKLMAKSSLTWDDLFQLVCDLKLTQKRTRWLLEICQDKINKSTRTSGLKTGEYVPLLLFLEKDVYQSIEKDIEFLNLKGTSHESIIENVVKETDNWVKTALKKEKSPVVKTPHKVPSQKKSAKLSQSSDFARWKDNPLIKIPTLEDVRIHLIEEKTVEETPEVRKRYRTYFCEVAEDDLLKPYWLELYIAKLEGAAKSKNEIISKIDPEAFKFVKIGYDNYGELEKAMGGVKGLLGNLEKDKLK